MTPFPAYVLAGIAALIPAGLGLMGNTTLAHDVPVRVPASAEVVPTASSSPSSDVGDDHGGDRDRTPSANPTSTSSPEPGDDHGGDRDRSTPTPSPTSSSSSDPGDDKGGDNSGSDDSGSDDDKSGSGGGDDNSGPGSGSDD